MTFNTNDLVDALTGCVRLMFIIGACMGTAAAAMQIGRAVFGSSIDDDYPSAGMYPSENDENNKKE